MNLFNGNYFNKFSLTILFVITLTILGYSKLDSVYSSKANNLPFQNVSSSNLKSENLGNNSMDGEAIDIDKDGDLDMIIAMEFRPNIILINDGKGNLIDESSKRFPSNRHDSEDIAIADFDKDGDDDIVFVSEDDKTNEYYENNGKAVFKSVKDKIPVSGTSNAVKTSDIDDDGDYDLLIGNQGQNFILINNKGVFSDETSKRLPKNEFTTQDLELADIDGDGDLDLLEANETFNQVLINVGKGFFKYEKDRLPEVDDQTRDADFGDVDNDGDLDIFFSNVSFGGFGNPQNRLLLNDGKGYFKEAKEGSIPKRGFQTVDADFVDIDNDKDLDILTGNRNGGNSMIVLINDGKGKFTDETEDFFPNVNFFAVDFQIADFNKDGKRDLYVCSFRSQDILLFGTKY